jgi:hypothetical protein
VGAAPDAREPDAGLRGEVDRLGHRPPAGEEAHPVVAVDQRHRGRDRVDGDHGPRVHHAAAQAGEVHRDAGDPVRVDPAQVRLDRPSATIAASERAALGLEQRAGEAVEGGGVEVGGLLVGQRLAFPPAVCACGSPDGSPLRRQRTERNSGDVGAAFVRLDRDGGLQRSGTGG